MTTRLERGLQILSLLESAGSYNAHQLASKLGVTRRTVFRDIALLRRLGWPVHFDADSSAYSLHAANESSSGSPGPGLPREFLSPDRDRKVGDDAREWDETLDAIARAVRGGQPLVLKKTSPRDGGAAVALRPMELVLSATGWSLKGWDLDSPDAATCTSVQLADYPVVVPLDPRPQNDPPLPTESATGSEGRASSAEDAG